MGFWEKAKGTVVTEKKEEVVDLQAKLSKLELSDINYIHDLMIERTYRGRELEQATTTYLKVKFIKTMLEGGIDVKEETKDS
jgi:hypothetical protein|tara:strand:- start:204 stop:449 length:246 start_codon:yes stop_codon:yes gene_type:complete